MDPKAQFTADELLAAIRLGNDQELVLKIGDKEVPCKILSYADESRAINSGKRKVREGSPSGKVDPADESAEIMKATLLAATNVKAVQYMGTEFLNRLSGAALDSLYDQYMTLMREVNPQFETLSEERIAEMIAAVKKKEKVARDFFTWERAAIGSWFLAHISHEANGPGR